MKASLSNQIKYESLSLELNMKPLRQCCTTHGRCTAGGGGGQASGPTALTAPSWCAPLLSITINYYQLPSITINYYQLLSNYYQSLSITIQLLSNSINLVCGGWRGGGGRLRRPPRAGAPQRQFFIDNLLVRIHFIIEMIRWTGLAPWEFELPFPGSLTSTFLVLIFSSLSYLPAHASAALGQGLDASAPREVLCVNIRVSSLDIQSHLAHKKPSPPQDHHRALGIGLLGPRGVRFLVSEVPL